MSDERTVSPRPPLNPDALLAQIEQAQSAGASENRRLRRDLEEVSDWAADSQIEYRAQNFAVSQVQAGVNVAAGAAFQLAPDPSELRNDARGTARSEKSDTSKGADVVPTAKETAGAEQREAAANARDEAERQHMSVASKGLGLGKIEDPVAHHQELTRLIAEITRRAAANAKIRG